MSNHPNRSKARIVLMEGNPDITLSAYAGRDTPIPVALGRAFANANQENALHLERLNRIYRKLSPADQLRCRAEILECKDARRGALEAAVSTPSPEKAA